MINVILAQLGIRETGVVIAEAPYTDESTTYCFLNTLVKVGSRELLLQGTYFYAAREFIGSAFESSEGTWELVGSTEERFPSNNTKINVKTNNPTNTNTNLLTSGCAQPAWSN